ncbi:Splicing factor U2af large subunit A [Hibiscus syriacus]|uniref:Splicing factor U2af large subunit A n=1 Tax=Hibiscus syriacus TaxID=106335 RepID=A0A6A3A9U0_HIBSY|nr:Splicing factor U2af large subunit A [Hibiscus syriacus]
MRGGSYELRHLILDRIIEWQFGESPNFSGDSQWPLTWTAGFESSGGSRVSIELAQLGQNWAPDIGSRILGTVVIGLQGAPVKVRRSGDYKPSLAATLGPSQPSPNLNLAAVGLSPGSAVKDRETGNSKGYAFCIYQDLSVTDIACAALNGIKMGDKTLTVRRANQGTTQPIPEQESILQHAQQPILQPQGVPTKVVCLTQAISEDDLRDDEEYGDIVEDMNGRRFGDNQAIAVFYPEDKFARGEYEA